MKKRKSFLAINNAPEPTKSILGGIAVELMEIDSLLRIEPLTTSENIYYDYGFRLVRRQMVLLTVILRDNIIGASHSEKTRQWHGSGNWWADIQDPERFAIWRRYCEEHVIRRIIYLIEEQIRRRESKIKLLRCVVSKQEYDIAYAKRNPNGRIKHAEEGSQTGLPPEGVREGHRETGRDWGGVAQPGREHLDQPQPVHGVDAQGRDVD